MLTPHRQFQEFTWGIWQHQSVVSGFNFLKLLAGPHVRNMVGEMVKGRKKHTKSTMYRDGVNEQTKRDPEKSWAFWTEVTQSDRNDSMK